jgi:cell division protein FtsB
MKSLMSWYVGVSRGQLGGRVRSAPSVIVAAGLLAVLAAGCSAAGPSSAGASSASAARSGARAAPVPAGAPGAPAEPAQAGRSLAAGGAGTTASLALGGQDIVYTASLTVRATDISRAAALAEHIAVAAGGYVSSENTLLDRAHPAQSTVSLQLKIPVAAYPATLGALSTRLGTRISVSQHAQDVTETVADVTSRVTSAQAAITQLRALLARAGSVGDLLTVQNQIDQEESALESLQARERALSHETSDATVTLMLVSKPRAAVRKHERVAGGFLGGLEAGWHGLRVAVRVLLTGAGAALPFAGLAALAGYGAYRVRRWLRRRGATPPATGPSAAG